MEAQEVIAKLKQFPIAVAGIAVALLAGIVFSFRVGVVPELEKELNDAQKKLQTITRNSSQSVGLAQDTTQLETFTTQLDERTIDSTQRSTNINYFYGFEDQSNVRITSINQGNAILPPRKGTKPFNSLRRHAIVNISLEAEGAFRDLLNFAHNIRMGQKLTRISRFNFTAGSQTDPTMRMVLIVEVFGESLGK